jgi:hypothetical protein
MVLATFAVAVFAVLGFGYTDADLLAIVNTEITPEISIAAGLNLGEYYLANFADDLEMLAEMGLTPGIKAAAAKAIELSMPSVFERVEALLVTDGAAQVAIAAQEEAYAELETAEEVAAAKKADILALTDLDMARAYFFYYRSDAALINATTLATDFAADGPVGIAAGEVLGGFYAPGSFNTITLDEALDLALNGANDTLRVAGEIVARTYVLVEQPMADLTDEELMVMALQVTGGADPVNALLYQLILTDRFSN